MKPSIENIYQQNKNLVYAYLKNRYPEMKNKEIERVLKRVWKDLVDHVDFVYEMDEKSRYVWLCMRTLRYVHT